MEVIFRKYKTDRHDFLVLDTEHTKFDLLPQNIRLVCDYKEGLGADFLLCGPRYDGMTHHFSCYRADGTILAEEATAEISRVCSRALQDTGHLPGMELDTEGVHLIASIALAQEYLNANGLQDVIPT